MANFECSEKLGLFFKNMNGVIQEYLESNPKFQRTFDAYKENPKATWQVMLFDKPNGPPARTSRTVMALLSRPGVVFSQALAGRGGHESDLVYLEKGVNAVKGIVGALVFSEGDAWSLYTF